jgi:hypothetical protein
MKINYKFITITALAAAFLVLQACSFSSANMSSLTTSTDKEGKTPATSFKTGDTLYAKAQISNNPGKVKVKYYWVAEDVKGSTKGETLKGSEVSVDIDGDKSADYSLPISPALSAGTYMLTADMLNDAGEKKGNKSVKVTITQTAPPAAPANDDDDDKDTDHK